MIHPGERGQSTLIKLAFGILIGLLLFVFLCWGGYRLYTVFESRHQARRAAAYLSGGDLRQAALTARHALQLDPSSIAATRVVAEVAERANDRTALAYRRKAAELQPDSIEDTFALVNCLLQFGDVAAAEKTLRQLNEKAHQTAEFHSAAARLAEARKEPAEAEKQWAEAVRLAPENKLYQLQFALALLKIGDPAKREAGLAMLGKLRADDKQRAAATRALIIDGIAHHGGGQDLAAMAGELQDYPEAKFSDRLLYADILRQLRDPKFTEYLTELEKDATSSPTNLAAVLSWMNANGMSLLAVDFAHTVSGDELAKWPVPLAIAESYGKLADWRELENLVKDRNWGPFDFLRHAYLSRALRKTGRPVAADREWTAAEKQAGAQEQSLSLLWRTVSGWGWKEESLDLLWMLTKHPETRLEAFEALYQEYNQTADTPGLYRVLMRSAELMPEDRRIQNNLAQLRLLLNADVGRARKIAAEVYSKEPSNSAYASTYAFALYTSGDTKGALKVMNTLSESQLQDPSVALYYGVLLAAAGESEKARDYLSRAASAKLLPEERELMSKAEDSLK